MGTFTLETGLGMLLTGLVVIAIAGTLIFVAIKTIEHNRIKQEREKKARERIHGLD